MFIIASWEGAEVEVEVDGACRSLAALRRAILAALPELDTEKVLLEMGGCAVVDEAVCGLEAGSVVTVVPTPAVRAAATLREGGRTVDMNGFCLAAVVGDMPVCELYLEAGVVFEPGCATTPLHVACVYRNFELSNFLIIRGFPMDIQDRNFSYTPLHVAVLQSDVKMCKLLIFKGCPLDAGDEAEDTPLHVAVWVASVELDEVNEGGEPLARCPLRLASLDVCKFLIDQGCSMSAPNFQKKSPLDNAISSKHAPLSKLFFDRQRADARAQREDAR